MMGFLAPPSSAIARRRRTKSRRRVDADDGRATFSAMTASLAPDEAGCYVPPYGMVPRKSSIVLNMMVNDGNNGGDDRFRKKMNDRRTKDPVVQDFGGFGDWDAIKTGRGRMGDDKAGDDRVSELGGFPVMDGAGFDAMERRRPPPPAMFEGDGGNFWVNPPANMDRYPARFENGGMSRRRPGGRRSRGGDRRGRGMDDGGEWFETRRDEEYDDDEFDDFDGDFEGYPGGEYGVPPPSRSRSSFRSGAPPPPRPVKQFYDKLFWFGFDPDVTRPTDRTMFGGTRGKFNAMHLLGDRDLSRDVSGGSRVAIETFR